MDNKQSNPTNACERESACCVPLHYVEKIAKNEAGIRCLNGRVGRAEQDLRERYSKDEVDRMLAQKADRCAFEKHLLDACGTEECGGPAPCACDCYSKEEIDALLKTKEDVGPVKVYPLELEDGLTEQVENRNYYFKTKENIVFVHCDVVSDREFDSTGKVIAYLPQGFRPNPSTSTIAMFTPGHAAARIAVGEDGAIYTNTNRDITVAANRVFGQIFFPAAD